MFDHGDFDEHEHILFVCRADVGLRAIIALHDTRLGPALGGCRMWPHADTDSALADVLRLARGMTHKNALARLPFGGGKSLIVGDPRRDKSDALLDAFAEAVDSLGGRYVVAEDVGMTPADMQRLRKRTAYVSGVVGDPSPYTAHGVLVGLTAAVRLVQARDDLAGLRVAVQGLGAVGWKLAALLHEQGAVLVVADVDAGRVDAARNAFGARAMEPDAILGAEVDVLAPCALGAVLDAATIPQLRCAIVAGAANNQLATPADGARLAARGIVYVPDYVLNAGGVIAVAAEYQEQGSAAELDRRVAAIGETVRTILDRAAADGLSPATVAERAARAALPSRDGVPRAA
ncbi:MAG: Glu/Leu/Phe/Val dehydrogenase dimerization domain-containing protein [Pseudomonadota bacterium]